MAAAGTARTPRALVLLVMCLALFMSLLESTALSLILPAIRADLHVALPSLVWVANAYLVIFAALLLTAGSLGDRFGPARMFLVGLAVFTTGSAVCAYAGDLGTLVTGRVVQGLGATLLVPQTLAILTHTFPDARDRARAFGVWSGVSGLALVLGPVVGGVLADVWGWRSVFFVNVPIGALTVLLGLRVLRHHLRHAQSRPEGDRRGFDLPGQALTVLALGGFTFILVEGARLGWLSPVVVGVLAVAVLAAAGLVLVERRVAAPMLPVDLFRSGTFAASAVVLTLTAFGMYASFFLVSLFLQQVQGYSPAAAGVRFMPAMATVVVASLAAGVVAGRIGSRVPAVTGTALIGVSLLLLSRVDADTSYGVVWPLLVALGAGIGATIPPVNSALMGAAPPGRSAVASATAEIGKQLGALVGIAVLSGLVTAGLQRVVAQRADDAGLGGRDPAELSRTLFAEGAGAVGDAGARVGALAADGLTTGIGWGLATAGAAALVGSVVALRIRPSAGGHGPPAEETATARTGAAHADANAE